VRPHCELRPVRQRPCRSAWGHKWRLTCPSGGLVEPLRDRVEAIAQHACVHVQRPGRGRVSEHPLHRLDVGPGLHRQAGRGVP
jgi:hypothetical protein